MTIFQSILFLLAVAVYAKLVYMRAIMDEKAKTLPSAFEVRRQGSNTTWPGTLRPSVHTLWRLSNTVLIVVFILLLLGALSWFGVVAAIVCLWVVGKWARIPYVVRVSRKLYKRVESAVLAIAEKGQPILRLFAEPTDTPEPKEVLPHSHDELLYMIEHAGTWLHPDEKAHLIKALAFKDIRVKSIMTTFRTMTMVKKTEILGPKLLDELHKTGQSFFPVVDSSGAVLGILSAHEIMNTQRQGKVTAVKAMDHDMLYVHEADSLEVALHRFLREKQFFGIVRDNSEETIGVITLNDIIAKLVYVSL